jgi:hypothetical protein
MGIQGVRPSRVPEALGPRLRGDAGAKPHDGLAQVGGEFAAAALTRSLRLTERHHRREARSVHCAPDRSHQRLVAQVERTGAVLPRRIVDEAQRQRLHGRAGRDGRLDQVGVEGQHAAAVARGALGKHRNDLPGPQAVGDLVHHVHHVATVFALDVERAGAGGERPDQRPVPDVGFRHEPAVPRRMDHQDVEPGNVIGHQQHRPTRGGCPAHLERDAHGTHHVPGPALHPRFALGLRHAREQESDRAPAREHLPERAEGAPEPSHRYARSQPS